jgi:hypothetical protein
VKKKEKRKNEKILHDYVWSMEVKILNVEKIGHYVGKPKR